MSSPPCCWGSTNGSPEVIQEFVICEFNRNPHCQLVRPSSAATSCLFLTLTLIVLLFRPDIREKPEGQRRALASACLTGAQLLKSLFHVAYATQPFVAVAGPSQIPSGSSA